MLFRALDSLIQVGEPYKTLLISGIVTTLTCLSVIIIGLLIERLQRLEMKLLRNVFSNNLSVFIIDRVTFPGTMLHECAHALFAWFTGAQVQRVKLLTFFNAHTLGEVIYAPRGNKLQQHVQMTFTSCAPVIMGIIELSILAKLFQTFIFPFWLSFLLSYLFICILNHMSMSDVDIKCYLRGLIFVFPILFLFSYAARLWLYR